MNEFDILKQTGAKPESYLYSQEDLELKPKIQPPKKILCKIADIFSKFSLEENHIFPSYEKNNLAEFDFKHLENALYDQTEKFLCENSLSSDSQLIYDAQMT